MRKFRYRLFYDLMKDVVNAPTHGVADLKKWIPILWANPHLIGDSVDTDWHYVHFSLLDGGMWNQQRLVCAPTPQQAVKWVTAYHSFPADVMWKRLQPTVRQVFWEDSLKKQEVIYAKALGILSS